MPSISWHSAKPLPSARQKALGKDVFADEIAAECPLPSVIRALPSVPDTRQSP
jgi:hypothetical protein